MMEHGRKFVLTVFGMVLVFILSLLGKGDMDAITAIGGMVLAFNGANSVVSWAYSRQVQEVVEVQQEERDARVGFQPTP